jgi:hypothetical protein
MPAVFDLNTSGSGTVGTSIYVALDSIPSGFRDWLGFARFTAYSKQMTFNLRGNITGQSVGTDGATVSINSNSVKSGTTVSVDLYQKGRLHKVTPYSTGIEKLWLKVSAKSLTAAVFEYSVDFTRE